MKRKRVYLFISLLLLLFFLLLALFPNLFTLYGRKEIFEAWLDPSLTHILGTNSLGYDVWTELVYGSFDTILIAFSASTISLVIGTLIGLLSNVKGFVGVLFNGLVQVMVYLPKTLCLIVLSVFLGQKMWVTILLIGIFTFAPTSKTVQKKTASLLKMPFAREQVLYGYSSAHIYLHHVLPNLKDVVSTRFLLSITASIMMESTLSFLGLGDLYYPTWGVMINFARSRGALFRGAYWSLIAPCLAIALFSISVYLLSLAIEKDEVEVKD